MIIQEQIDFCKSQSLTASDPERIIYKTIINTLMIADKYDLVPTDISGEDYQQFIGAYFEFRRSRGSEPRMNPASGKAMKEIIRYLMKIEKISGDATKALEAWRFMLERWNYLSDYIRQQVGLSQINKNIEEIIEQLTNASKKAKQQHNQSEKLRLKETIKNRG